MINWRAVGGCWLLTEEELKGNIGKGSYIHFNQEMQGESEESRNRAAGARSSTTVIL